MAKFNSFMYLDIYVHFYIKLTADIVFTIHKLCIWAWKNQIK